MIKIITPGHRVYRKTCYYCQCVFAFEEEDVKKDEIFDRGVSYGFEKWIKCPYCESRLDVNKTDIYVDKKEEHEFPPQTVEAISGVSPV